MKTLRRFYVIFSIMLNLVGFAIIFVIIGNGEQVENLVYIAGSDASFISIVAIAGMLANLGLAYSLWKLGLERRRRDTSLAQDRRTPFTGA